MKEQQIPDLFYVDDIALLADKQGDIQRLADICGQKGEALGFRFSVKKFGLMVFNDSNDQAVLIQGQQIPRVREYKYMDKRGEYILGSTGKKNTIAKGEKCCHNETQGVMGIQ